MTVFSTSTPLFSAAMSAEVGSLAFIKAQLRLCVDNEIEETTANLGRGQQTGDTYSSAEPRGVGVSAALPDQTIPGTKILRVKHGFPHVNFCFRFSRHVTEEDASKFDEQVQIADVVVPEADSWNHTLQTMLQELSYGRLTPDTFRQRWGVWGDFDGFLKAICKAIYNSGKLIILVDIPSVDSADPTEIERVKEYERLDREYQKHKTDARHYADGRNYEKGLSEFRLYLECYGRAANIRDRIIVERLKRLLTQVQDPLVSNDNRDVNIFVSLGRAHARIFQMLATELGIEASSNTDNSDIHRRYSYNDIAKHRARTGLPIDDTLISRALHELQLHILLYGLYEFTDMIPSDDDVMVYKYIASQFTLEEHRRRGPFRAFEDYLQYFADKGIPIPQTQTEYDDLVKKVKAELEKDGAPPAEVRLRRTKAGKEDDIDPEPHG